MPVKTVFLDRDGVINKKMPEGEYVSSQDLFQLLPGALDAIASMKHAGIRVIVVSNQRGISLGLYSKEDVERIHEILQGQLATRNVEVDGFYFCPHGKGECNCRKPSPGLFEQAKADFPDIEAATSLMIGDSLSDLEFGKRLGMLTGFVEGDPNNSKPGGAEAKAIADFVCDSLATAVRLIRDLGQERGSQLAQR